MARLDALPTPAEYWQRQALQGRFAPPPPPPLVAAATLVAEEFSLDCAAIAAVQASMAALALPPPPGLAQLSDADFSAALARLQAQQARRA